MDKIFKPGDNVTYTAYHGATPEKGVVSSVKNNSDGTQNVWVRFKGPTGELTPVSKLKK